MYVIDYIVGRHFKRLEKLLLERMKSEKLSVNIQGLIMATVSKSFDFLLDDLYSANKCLFKKQKNVDK